MEAEPSQPPAENGAAENKSTLDKDWADFNSTCKDLIARSEDFSKRLFQEAGNYKSKQGLQKDEPGKQDFRSLGTGIRRLQKHGEKAYKKSKPAAKRKQSEKAKSSGFNRIVITSEKMAVFLCCSDWDLSSAVTPNRGVVTHGYVTRYFNNYLALNGCRNPKPPKTEGKKEKATWHADERLKALFADEWEKEGVDPMKAKYVDLQKLLKHHMVTAAADSHEKRNEERYRKVLNDDGKLGKATKDVLTLRNELDKLATKTLSQSKTLATARSRPTHASLVPGYTAELQGSVARYNELGQQIRSICQTNNFQIIANYPPPLSTALDAK